MKQPNRSIHVNARIHPKMNENNQRKFLANLTSEYGISSTKLEIRKEPQLHRHSIHVQHIARKPSLSKGKNKRTQKIEKKNTPWILQRYLQKNCAQSDENHLRNPSTVVGNRSTADVHPMEQTSVGSTQNSTRISLESASVTSTNTVHPRQRERPPIRRSSRFGQIRDLITEKQRKKRKSACRSCYIIIFIILLALLLAGLAALIAALLSKNSSTTNGSTTSLSTAVATATTTVTSYFSVSVSVSCTSVGRGTLFALNGSVPLSWTKYQLNYTATNSSHTLSFGFRNENNREYYFDQVSLVATNDTTTELLINSNFDNSTTNLTGWNQVCTNNCGGYPGIISSNVNCFNASCYMDKCRAISGIDFLEQTLSAMIGQTYTISFMLLLTGSGTAADNAFFVDIL